MMRIAFTTIVMMAAAMAWADEPSAPDAKTETAPEAVQQDSAPAPQAAQENSAEQATASEQATDQPAEAAAAQTKADDKPFKVPPGYRTKRINGKTVYCASSSVVGTRFGKERCRTEAQLREIARQREAATMQQNEAACSGASVCAKN